MKKNVASQVIGVQMITAADGTAFTGTATVVITVDGGTQSASGGTGPTHEGNGFHTYLPTQAETNGDHIGFTFTGSGAIPVTIQVYTGFPQTVDNDVLASGATGFAAIDTVVDTINSNVGTAGAGLTNIGTIATVTNLTNLPTIPTDWLTAAGTAADFTTEIQAGLSTAAALATAQSDLDIITGATGVNLLAATQASIDAIETDTSTTLQGELDAIQAAVITNAAGVDIAADIIAIKAETSLIVADTNELQTDDIPTTLATLATTTELNKVPKSDGTTSWNATALGAINAEADTALIDYDPPTRAELTTDIGTIITDLDDIKGTSFIKDTHSLIDIKTETALIVADTNELQTDDIPTTLATLATTTELNKVPKSDGTSSWNLTALAAINAEADTALTDYDPPTNAEMEARTPTAAQLAYIVDNAATGVPVVFTTAGGDTTTAVLNTVDGSAASATDDQYNGRLLVFTDGTLAGVVTDITDYVGSTTTATITAIPLAPTSSHNARLI